MSFYVIFVLNWITTLFSKLSTFKAGPLILVSTVIRDLKWNHKIQTPPQVLFNFLTTSKKLGYQVMLRNAIWKLGIAEIAKAYRHIGKDPGPTAAKINVLAHIGLWPMIIKLNPSWKMEVSQSTWISPCYCLWVMKFLYVFILK